MLRYADSMELIPLQLGSVRQQDLFTRVHTDGAYFTLTEAWTGRHLAVLGPAVDLPEADTVGISELHGDRWASLVHRVHETGREVIIARNRRPIAALRPPADREAAEPRDPELWAHAERACAAEMAKRSRLVAGMADPAAVAELATEIAYDLWDVFDRYGISRNTVATTECDVPRAAVNAAALTLR